MRAQESPSEIATPHATSALTVSRLRYWGHSVRDTLAGDWAGPRYFPVGVAVVAITSIVTIVFYANHPQPEVYPDTKTYLQVAQRILTNGQFVDAERMPGYPMFIAVLFQVFGPGNLEVVSIAQGVLFVLATLEIYALAYLIVRRAAIAAGLALLVGSNVYLLAAIKPVLSEALALWFVATLALAVALFVRHVQPAEWWIVTAVLLLTIFTRAEWMYLPPVLFAYLLFIASRRGRLRILLPHALAATVVIYGAVAGYAALTAAHYGFFGVTNKRPVLMLGKVMQYRMQNEAPSEYNQVAIIVNRYVSSGVHDPAVVLQHEPSLSRDEFALAGAYSTAIIERHPVQFIVDSLIFCWRSLSRTSDYYPNALIRPSGPFATPLAMLRWLAALLFRSFQLFPFTVLLYAGCLLWKGTSRSLEVEFISALVLMALYVVGIAGMGMPSYADYTRLQTAVDPLLILMLFATLYLVGRCALRRLLRDERPEESAAQITGPQRDAQLALSVDGDHARPHLVEGDNPALGPFR